MIQIVDEQVYSGHLGGVYTLFRGLKEYQFYSGGGDGNVVEWTIGSDIGRVIAKVPEPIFSICLDSKMGIIYCGTQTGNVYRINLIIEEQPRKLTIHRGSVFGIEIIENVMFTIGSDGILSEIDLLEYEFKVGWKISPYGLRCFVMDSIKNCYYIAGQHGLIFKFDLQSKEVILLDKLASQKTIFSMAIDSSYRRLFLGGLDALLRCFELNSFKEVIEPIKAHWYTINSIQLLHSQALIVTASRDKTIRIWEAGTYKLLKEISKFNNQSQERSVNKLLWIEPLNLLLSASDSGVIKSWKILENDIKR